MILEVTATSMHGESVPTGFKLGGTMLAVCEIIDRWPGENYSYFKVRAEDEALYILRHDKIAAQWELTLFSRRE
jgi:hypothetical protein